MTATEAGTAAGTAAYVQLAEGMHLLSGAALALSFVLLYQQRTRAMVRVYAVQALAAALLAGLHGWVQGAAGPLLGSVLLAAGAFAMLPALRRQAGARLPQGSLAPGSAPGSALGRAIRDGIPQARSKLGSGVVASMALGVAVVAVAVFVVQAAPLPLPGSAVPTREDLAFALAVVLLGLLAAASRDAPLAQAVGLLSMWNGLVLATAGDAWMALLVAGSAGLLAPTAAVAFGGDDEGARPGDAATGGHPGLRGPGAPVPNRTVRTE